MDWLWICLDCGATIISDSCLFRNYSREESRCQICKHEFPTPMYIPDMECKPGWGILWYEADMSEECNIGAGWSIDWWA